MTDLELIQDSCENLYNFQFKPFAEFSDLFDAEKDYLHYFKKVLTFTKSVIEPLRNKGLAFDDSILDLASGDGQMSLALALAGYKNITMFDLDPSRLTKAVKIIERHYPQTNIQIINDSATELDSQFDVLICYQTLEHLSDEGNYSIAKRHCQKEFLRRVNKNITKMCLLNAPNYLYLRDGHDTGLPFFHYLPMTLKKLLIEHGIVKCSWAGICLPVSMRFLRKHLINFKQSSNYYAFDTMIEYIENRPPFSYMGDRIAPIDMNQLPFRKQLINKVSEILGPHGQNFLPVLSVIFTRSASTLQ